MKSGSLSRSRVGLSTVLTKISLANDRNGMAMKSSSGSKRNSKMSEMLCK